MQIVPISSSRNERPALSLISAEARPNLTLAVNNAPVIPPAPERVEQDTQPHDGEDFGLIAALCWGIPASIGVMLAGYVGIMLGDIVKIILDAMGLQ